MAELRSLLAFMDPEDRERALRRYEQLFDRAGEAGEEMLLQELGSPIRQVLEVDREYRQARKAGKLIYSEELPNQVSETDEMIPAHREEAPADLGQTVREAAAALEKYEESETEKKSAESGGEEDLFPIADLEFPDAPLPAEDADAPGKEAGPAGLSDLPAAAPAAAEALTDQSAEPTADESDEINDEEVEHIMRFASDYTAKREEAIDGEGYPQVEEKPGAARVFAAVLITVPLIVLWAVGIALSLALGAAMMAIGFAFCAAGVYFAGYAVNGYIAFMPDLLLVCGGALGCFALALFFLWLGLWFVVGGIAALARTTGRIYRSILKRRKLEDVDDE